MRARANPLLWKQPLPLMSRYVAFLRGVSPMNLKMAALKSCLEAAGFERVATVLSSGNAVFDACARSSSAVEKAMEAAMTAHLGKVFTPYVRLVEELQQLLALDPFAEFELEAAAKRVVTFTRGFTRPVPRFPLEHKGARLLAFNGRELFSAYVPNSEGPVFMSLIEKYFGTEVTTRTWATVSKCASA